MLARLEMLEVLRGCRGKRFSRTVYRHKTLRNIVPFVYRNDSDEFTTTIPHHAGVCFTVVYCTVTIWADDEAAPAIHIEYKGHSLCKSMTMLLYYQSSTIHSFKIRCTGSEWDLEFQNPQNIELGSEFS